MAELVNITSIDPNTFEAQSYSIQDESLITSINIESAFNPTTDVIEYFIYDLNGDIIFLNTSGWPGYNLIDNNLVLDPVEDLKSLGYDEGQYNTVYNFVSPILGSNAFSQYFISEISPDRTEVRLDTTDIPNEVVVTSSLELINNIATATGSYYDFYLDFNDNKLLISLNALLDTSVVDNPTVLIKLYEPLPEEFDINSSCWVVTQVANPVAYNINISQTFDLLEENIPLRGPNTNISVQDQIANSTPYSNLNQLNTTNQSQGTGSLQYQLNSMLAQTGVEINVDYSNYDNFIHFSSAQTRLENFYYKLSLLEQYQFSSSLSSGTTTNFYVSSSNIIWQAKIDEIITGFDDYEYYLYYTSGSTSWPKTGNTPPYTNVSTTSVAGQNWFISQSAVAEEYDIQNNNALVNAIPSYLREDTENAQFELFVEMIGQYFDTVFLYTQDITNKYNVDNRINYGVSKDLVADILKDMGIKIYQNNFSSNDLYSALLGFTPSGSLFNLPYTTGSLPTPTGFEYINTYVTASATGSLVPTEDINAEIYKRIYSNLPYLLKKKGTVEGLKALVTLYGIPDTILQVNEFGGQNEIDENDYDLWFNQFNYAFDAQGSQYVTSSWQVDSLWNVNIPLTLQFRFQTRGLPTDTGYYSQSLWTTDQGAAIRLRYTGSGFTSGSYSGSIPDPYNEYTLLEFIPDTSDLTTSASVYLPFYDGDWWNVMVTTDLNTSDFILYAGNKTTPGGNYNTYQFLASSSINGNTGSWENGTVSYFPATSNTSLGKMFSGSYQEIRYYNEIVTVDPFEDYIMYPYSIDANGINTAPDTLIFRATLGGELYTSSISIHPKVTGSWVTTSSFVGTSDFYLSSTDLFVPNTEFVYPNQFPAGIKNRVSNKIRQQNEVLPYSGSNEVNLPQNTALSPFISVQQDVPESGSYTPDIDYVEVAFSPQNEINNDIAGQLGYFNIGEYIGDPRLVSSSAESYPSLDALRDYYFEKYTSNYNFWDYIRLIKYFDNSLFKMIQDWVPARTNLAAGIVIKQTTLERNKYPVPQLDLSSSLAMVASNATSSVIFFQGNDDISGGLCYPITASGVYNLYATGSIFNDTGDDPTDVEIYITFPGGGIASLDIIAVPLSATNPFEVNYNAYIPSGSQLCFAPDSLGDFYINNVTASLQIANTTTFPYTTEDLLITGSPIQMYEISGSTGGTMPDLFGLTQSFYTGNNVVNITQSWTGSTPSLLGPVSFTDSTQIEFFNGELSGSTLQVEDGELNPLNPYKLADTTFITYDFYQYTLNEDDFSNRTFENAFLALTPNTGEIFVYNFFDSPSTSGLLPRPTYGNKWIIVNKTSSNSIYLENTLGNLEEINIAGATIMGSQKFIILSIQERANDFVYLVAPNNIGFSLATGFSGTQGESAGSRQIVLSPFDSTLFFNSEFNSIINNAVIARPNDEFFDVDFSSNTLTAINSSVIINASRGSGSATPSTTPASNYTIARSANPRYFGSRNTSPDFNVGNNGGEPSVESEHTYFAYFDGFGGTTAEIIPKTAFFVKFLVDELGNVYTPNLTGSYYSNLTRTFNENNKANVLFYGQTTSFDTSFAGIKPVIKSGELAQAIIFSQTSSIAPAALTTMSFSSTILTTSYNIQANISSLSYSSPSTFETLNLITPTTSGSTATTASLPNDYLAIQQSDPSLLIFPKLYTQIIYSDLSGYGQSIDLTFLLQKSNDNGLTFTNLYSTSSLLVSNNSIIREFDITPDVGDTAISGSRYRAQIIFENNGGFPSQATYDLTISTGNFRLVSDPPFAPDVTSSFWQTGSNSKNILTGSQFNSDIYGISRQSEVVGSGYDFPYQPFIVKRGDQIRFSADENQLYMITDVNPTTSSLFLTLDRPIVDFTNLDSFLLKTFIPNPNIVILNVDKTIAGGGNTPGFLLPEFTSQTILDKFDTIIANLSEKGLI